MMDSCAQSAEPQSIEEVLRQELAGADAALATVSPIMRHLLGAVRGTMLADAVIAAVRGMAADLAGQLLDARARANGEADRTEHSPQQVAELTEALTASQALIGHLHALAVEWKLSQQLEVRLTLDPVLSPLMQSEMASSNAESAALAMRFLAAQARFCQSQRRMQLPLAELPGDLLHGALIALRTTSAQPDDAAAEQAASALRRDYDESRTRLGLAARMVSGMAEGGLAALSLSNAGAALFLSALSIGARLDRDLAALATDESQLARLALALRACGLKQPAVDEQFMALHPDFGLPEGFDTVSPDQAAALLALAAPGQGG